MCTDKCLAVSYVRLGTPGRSLQSRIRVQSSLFAILWSRCFILSSFTVLNMPAGAPPDAAGPRSLLPDLTLLSDPKAPRRPLKNPILVGLVGGNRRGAV